MRALIPVAEEGPPLTDETPGADEANHGAPLAALRWRFVGPYRGGRVMAVAGHPTARRTFYAGTSSGGVWRTDNSGAA